MPDTQNRDKLGTDDFSKRLMNGKVIDQASPKMSEYIEMMAAYLLVREKSVLKKSTEKDVKMS